MALDLHILRRHGVLLRQCHITDQATLCVLCGRPHNGQVMTGENASRRAEDIGGSELSYAEVKAIASGNPAVLTLAEADAEIQRLSVLKRNHADEQYLARRSVRSLPETIERLKARLAGLAGDQATMKTHEDDAITIGTRQGADPLPALAEALDRLPQFVMQDRRVPLGNYRGLRFGMVLHPQWRPEVYLEGAITRQESLSREHQGPRAVLNALERLASSYGSVHAHTRQELELAETQLHCYQERLGRTFTHEDYLTRLATLRDQLKAALSGGTQAADGQALPDAAALAQQIKALRAENTIEATPERTAKRHTSAEEPVTAKIRRRAEALPPSPPAMEPDGEASTAPIPAPDDSEPPPHHEAASHPGMAAVSGRPERQRPHRETHPASAGRSR